MSEIDRLKEQLRDHPIKAGEAAAPSLIPGSSAFARLIVELIERVEALEAERPPEVR